jgi:hypothetical protein
VTPIQSFQPVAIEKPSSESHLENKILEEVKIDEIKEADEYNWNFV